MLRPFLLCIWISAVAASSAPRVGNPLAKLPQRLGQPSTASKYFVSTKTSDEPSKDVTESSWWPLWKSSSANQKNATLVEKEDPEPSKENPKRRWGRKEKTTEEAEAEEPKDEPKKKNNKKKKKKAQKEDTKGKKEEEESEGKKDISKRKKGEEEPVEEKEIDANKSNATDATSSNSTSTEFESQLEQEKKREALEKYKELYKLRQHMLSSNAPPRDGRGLHLSPEEQYKQMRNAETSMAMVQLVTSLVGLTIRYGFLLWATRFWGNREEKIHPVQHFVFERLNDRFMRDALALKSAIDEPPVGVSKVRWGLLLSKRNRMPQVNLFNGQASLDNTFEKTGVVIELGKDADADMDLKFLADLITFLLSQHQAHAFGSAPREKRQRGVAPEPPKPLDLEVIFKVNSPGGAVSTFGLAAAQLARLRGVAGISTTVCIDKIAASGGYMIASQANKLVAAPFAYVGSIGVIVETLNFHDILKSYGVTPLVLKAGEAKNPLTTFGPITKKEISVEQERMTKVHELFTEYTIQGRPVLEGKEGEVCDGSVFMGSEALGLGLVDEVMTSDEYLMKRMLAGDRLLKVYKSRQSRIAPHMRFPTAHELLPFLKARIEAFASSPETATKLVKLGSFIGFVHHLACKYLGKTTV